MSDPGKFREMVVIIVGSQWVEVQKRKSTNRLAFKNSGGKNNWKALVA